ncbi:MAG: hypothetical protein SX243_07945 [Acidobacteriota bacterium]|nr:hypothetical protein [Acidobacteriota bacterium]
MSTPHPPSVPSLRQLVASQVVLYLLHAHRAKAIIFGLILLQVLLLATVGILLGVTIVVDGEQTRWFFSDISDTGLSEAVAAVLIGAGLASVWGLFVPFGWPDQQRYAWSLPVDRKRLDIARFLAGLLITLTSSSLVLGLAALAAAMAGNLAQLSVLGPLGWLNLWLAPFLAFLLTCADATRKDRSKTTYWLIEAGGTVLLLLVTGPGFLTWPSIKATFFDGPLSAFNALTGAAGHQIFGAEFFYPEHWAWALALWCAVHLGGFLINIQKRY